MFQDIGVSKDLNEQFKKHLQESSGEPLDSELNVVFFSVNRFSLKASADSAVKSLFLLLPLCLLPSLLFHGGKCALVILLRKKLKTGTCLHL